MTKYFDRDSIHPWFPGVHYPGRAGPGVHKNLMDLYLMAIPVVEFKLGDVKSIRLLPGARQNLMDLYLMAIPVVEFKLEDTKSIRLLLTIFKELMAILQKFGPIFTKWKILNLTWIKSIYPIWKLYFFEKFYLGFHIKTCCSLKYFLIRS